MKPRRPAAARHDHPTSTLSAINTRVAPKAAAETGRDSPGTKFNNADIGN